jgi:glutamine amidotransferase
MPKMLNMLNLAGVRAARLGSGSHQPEKPFFYGSPSLPVFDRNLKNLAGKGARRCVLAHVRGVAYSAAVEISLQNVHPFQFEGVPWALAHNGDLAGMEALKPRLAPHIQPRFPRRHPRHDRQRMDLRALHVAARRPRRRRREDEAFEALGRTLAALRQARAEAGVSVSSSVNLFIANGHQLVALRYCFDFGRYDVEVVKRDALDERTRPTSASCRSGTRSVATTRCAATSGR